jgi:adenylate cyclase
MTTPNSETVAHVWSWLLDRGVSPDDIHRAEADHTLHLLVIEHLIVPERPTYTPAQVADIVGMSLDEVRRYWRSLGLTDVADDVVAFSDRDVEALTTLNGLLRFRMVDEKVAVQMSRVIGSSMARIADAEIMASPVLSGAADDVARAELFIETADATLPSLARLLEYAWRRHLQVAARRGMLLRAAQDAPATANLAVGFADLVGFTAISQQVSDQALAELVGRFEEIAFDVVVRRGGRVVKMIGDEAMFVCDRPVDAVHIGIELAEAHSGEDSVAEVRVGIACGPVLPREGDYFGPVVNLASRIVNIANPGSVVVSGDVRQAVGDDPSFEWKSLRTRYLKEIGRVPLWAVVAADEDDERRGKRRRLRPGVIEVINELQRAGVEAIEAVKEKQA